jgi:hypothetical protein
MRMRSPHRLAAADQEDGALDRSVIKPRADRVIDLAALEREAELVEETALAPEVEGAPEVPTEPPAPAPAYLFPSPAETPVSAPPPGEPDVASQVSEAGGRSQAPDSYVGSEAATTEPAGEADVPTGPQVAASHVKIIRIT